MAAPFRPTGSGSNDLDWQLLAAVSRGDGGAFTELVERHQDRLVRLCERVLGDREEARDAAQEVFLKAYRHAGSVEPRGQLYTWLYRIALNHCFNRMRRRKIVRFFSLDRGRDGEEGETPPIDPVERRPDAEAELLARERWRRTRTAIDALPASQRVGAAAGPIRRTFATRDRRDARHHRRGGREPSGAGHAPAFRDGCAGWAPEPGFREGQGETMNASHRDHRRDRDREARLLRHLLGEGSPDERAEIARRLFEEPELAREAAELERIWKAVELPPAAPAPPGFAGRVSATLREREAPRFAERGLRWASAFALVAGIGAGAALSDSLASEIDEPEATLAESYLDAADEPGALSEGVEEDGGVEDPATVAPAGAESGL